MVTNRPSAATQQGAILLESLIAMLIFSMGILALVGLQAAMVSNTSGAKYRSEANYIAQQKLGELWADPEHISASDTLVNSLPNGRLQTEVIDLETGQVRIVVSWKAPDETQTHNVTSNARIMGAK